MIVINLRRQLVIQAILICVAFVAHLTLLRTGIGKYSKDEPKWYDIINLTLNVSTTTGMSATVPTNLPAMLVTWTHTVLIFLVLSL